MSLYSACLAQQTLNLANIPSVTQEEERLCLLLLNWIQESFPQATFRRERHSFWMTPRPLQARPTVALVGHMDTVPQANEQRYLQADNRVYGLGACDMKGGLAVMMHLLAGPAPDSCNLVGIFYDREEGPYSDNGLDLLLPNLPPIELAIVLEPTSNRIQAGCVGSMHCSLNFRGRRAHSARPWQGDNALHKMIPVLSKLATRERREVIVGGLPFYEVVTATQVHCDNPANAVPELVSLNLNYRFAPGKSREQACADIESEFAPLAEIHFRDFAPAGQVSLDHPQLRSWIEKNQLVTEAKQAWTDVARFTQSGIPAINFGPGDPAQAHQSDEYVEIPALHTCLELLRLLVP